MSSCAIRRWGTGTPCHKETVTAASKELSDKLKIMQAERMKQDSMWSANTTTYTSSEHSHQSTASSSSGTNQYGSSSK